MRGLICIALLAGCAFDPPGQVTATGDAAAPDSPPIPTDIAPATCPARYVDHFGGHSYFGTGSMSRSAAQTICAQDGGHLIKIETEGEALELADRVDTFPPIAVWIGIADHGTGVYVWEDGSAPGFARWNGLAPNAGDPDCVVANTTDFDGRWQATDCNVNRVGICECDAN